MLTVIITDSANILVSQGNSPCLTIRSEITLIRKQQVLTNSINILTYWLLTPVTPLRETWLKMDGCLLTDPIHCLTNRARDLLENNIFIWQQNFPTEVFLLLFPFDQEQVPVFFLFFFKCICRKTVFLRLGLASAVRLKFGWQESSSKFSSKC